MHAFDYIILLFSFVYAAAVTHILTTVGDMVIAASRVKFSWLNGGWMACVLAAVIAWWIGTWDLRSQQTWDMATIAIQFAIASSLYLLARLTCPRIAHDGPVDLRAFHLQEGRKYLVLFLAIEIVTCLFNAYYGMQPGAKEMLAQNLVVGPMAIATGAAVVFIRRPRVQAVALAVNLAMWVCYYAAFQQSLSG
jgi:hypothetical protein